MRAWRESEAARGACNGCTRGGMPGREERKDSALVRAAVEERPMLGSAAPTAERSEPSRSDLGYKERGVRGLRVDGTCRAHILFTCWGLGSTRAVRAHGG